jgi:hypothetical protein
MKEEEQESDLDAFCREAVGVAWSVPLQQAVPLELAQIVAQVVQAIALRRRLTQGLPLLESFSQRSAGQESNVHIAHGYARPPCRPGPNSASGVASELPAMRRRGRFDCPWRFREFRCWNLRARRVLRFDVRGPDPQNPRGRRGLLLYTAKVAPAADDCRGAPTVEHIRIGSTFMATGRPTQARDLGANSATVGCGASCRGRNTVR